LLRTTSEKADFFKVDPKISGNELVNCETELQKPGETTKGQLKQKQKKSEEDVQVMAYRNEAELLPK
jgi:hypothetical protein